MVVFLCAAEACSFAAFVSSFVAFFFFSLTGFIFSVVVSPESASVLGDFFAYDMSIVQIKVNIIITFI